MDTMSELKYKLFILPILYFPIYHSLAILCSTPKVWTGISKTNSILFEHISPVFYSQLANSDHGVFFFKSFHGSV
jgi:hypothetical protein